MNQKSNTIRELKRGATLHQGKYIIETEIGAGGFGITYKAIQSGLNKTVCIKEFFVDGKCVRHTQAQTVLLQGISEGLFEKYRKKFVEEAKLLASIKHPNIVEVFDVFDENNTSYFVMTFIEGKTLQGIVKQKKALTTEMAANYLGQIANAVEYIHSKNILHRDIKPDNILITPDEKAILIDFGSAREFVQDKTQSHTTMLTRGYAPPEQYNATSRKGSYSDIYSLGAVYYYALTGEEPTDAAVRQIETMAEPIKLNSKINADVNRTILKAMEIKPENRHQTIKEFLYDLVGEYPSEPIPTTHGVKKSRKWLWIALATVIVIAGIVVAVLLQNNDKQEREMFLFNEISNQERAMDSLNFRSTTLFLNPANQKCFHYFKDCVELGMVVEELTVKQVFSKDIVPLCEICANRTQEFENYCNEANLSVKFARNYYKEELFCLSDDFFNDALNWTNKALQMRPDNHEMLNLQKDIQDEK
jgi:serine/threonine protein kinase